MMTTIAELRLGDEVDLGLESYGTATVVKIKDGVVELIRPFIHIGEFSYTGGVLNYIGTETVKLFVDSTRRIRLVQRGPVLK